MFVFKRRTLTRLTRLMLSSYIMFYCMSFTVCAEENPISDMMVSQAVGMINQTVDANNSTAAVTVTEDEVLAMINNATDEAAIHEVNSTIQNDTMDTSNDTENLSSLNRGGMLLATRSAGGSRIIVVDGSSVDSVFDPDNSYRLAANVSDGDILDIQGSINAQHNLIVDKSVNIISSTNDGAIHLGGYTNNSFFVDTGAMSTNVTGISFGHGTSAVIYADKTAFNENSIDKLNVLGTNSTISNNSIRDFASFDQMVYISGNNFNGNVSLTSTAQGAEFTSNVFVGNLTINANECNVYDNQINGTVNIQAQDVQMIINRINGGVAVSEIANNTSFSGNELAGNLVFDSADNAISENEVIGNITVNGQGNDISGNNINGNVITTVNANNTILSNNRLDGNVTIGSSYSNLTENDIEGTVSINGNHNVIRDNTVISKEDIAVILNGNNNTVADNKLIAKVVSGQNAVVDNGSSNTISGNTGNVVVDNGEKITIYSDATTTGELMEQILNNSVSINNSNLTEIIISNDLKADNSGCSYDSVFESNNVDIQTNSLIFVGNGHTVKAANSSYDKPLLYLNSSHFSGVENITITDLNFAGAQAANADAGALYINNFGSAVNIINCTFDDNTAKNAGAISVNNEQRLLVEGCRFNNDMGQSGGAIFLSGSIQLTVEGNIFTNCLGDDGCIYIAPGSSITGNISHNAFLGGDKSIVSADFNANVKDESNWYGATVNLNLTPENHNVSSDVWICMNITRCIDETTGEYSMKAVPMLYNSTCGSTEVYTDDRLPMVELKCEALSGVTFQNNPSIISVNGRSSSNAVFSVNSTSSSYGVRVSVPGRSIPDDYTFNRGLGVGLNVGAIEYDPSMEQAVVPMENGEIIPQKVLENKTMSGIVNINYRGTTLNSTISGVPVNCSKISGQGTFNINLDERYIGRGDHNVTFEVEGFGSVEKVLHIPQTYTFVKCVNATYSDSMVSASTPELTNVESFKQGEGGSIKFFVGNHFNDKAVGKLYIMNGTSDISDTGRIVSVTNVTVMNQYALVALDSLNVGNYELVAVYHDDNSSPAFYDSNSSANTLTFSVKNDASVSALGGNTTINKVVGSEFSLNTTVENAGTSGTGIWTYTSNNESIATVSGNGTVTIKASGDVNVTATYESDTTKGSVKVTVHVLSLSEPVVKTGLIYNGEDQTLVIPGSIEQGSGAQLKYRLGDTGTFISDVPTAKEAGNYSVWYVIDGDSYNDAVPHSLGNVSIGSKDVSFAWSGTEFVYDGNEHLPFANITGVIDADKNGVGVSISGKQQNAGTYTATVTGLTGSKSANYKLPADCSCVYTIIPANVTLTANSLAVTYDGTAKSADGYSSSVDGLSFTGVSASASGTDAGDYNITFTGVTKGVTRDTTGNYVISATNNGKLTINPKNVTSPVIILSKDTYTYDSLNHEPSVTIKDANVTIDPTEYTVRYSGNKDAGTAGVTIFDVSGGNYIVSGNTTFKIERAAVTVKADDASKTYGDAEPVSYTATVTGLKGSDTESVISYTTQRASGEDAGNYTIIPTGDAIQGNYNVTFESGNLAIGRAPATVIPVNMTKTYGDNDPVFSATVSGLKNSDVASVITYTFSRATGEDAGNYTIAASGDSIQGNYEVTYSTGKLAIERAAVKVTADNITVEYGSSVPTLKATVTGLKNSDTESVISYSLDRASGTDIGNYTITASGAAQQGNYEVSFVNGVLSISKASQNAPSLTKKDETEYGKNDGTITGLTGSMEISSTKYDFGYSSITDLSGQGYKPGTYYIRYKETSTHKASPATVITINAAKKPVVEDNEAGGSNGSGSSDNGSSSNPSNDDYAVFMNQLRGAAKKGSIQTIVFSWGDSLSYEAMQILKENPQITLVFNFKWQGVEYSTTIGGGRPVFADKGTEWYGPANLKGRYGATVGRVNSVVNDNSVTGKISGYYVVKKGDNLTKIARKLHVTVNYLVQKNNIRNKNKIKPGQIIYY